jgi:LacI family transcriptional regulator
MAVTLKELARLAGVSHTVVSMVMRDRCEGRVSEAKRRRIVSLARKHGYRPNVAARGLVQQRTYRIALCIHGALADRPLLGQFSFHEALARAARRVQEAGYTLELVETDPGRRIEETCRALAGRTVDGFALLGWPPAHAERVLLSLCEKRIPAVAVGAALADEGLTWTDVDRAFAMRAAVSRLASEGRSQAALLDLDVGGSYRREKRNAFQREMTRRHGARAGKRVFSMTVPHIEDAIRVTQDALDRVRGLNALVLTDNFFADAVMLALRQRGMEPGKDCRLVGLGDTILAERTRPRLTHYSLMVSEQVAFALDALLQQVASSERIPPRHRTFEPVLVGGET